ncbi:MAG: FeS-binding protein [Chloroflexi bacterium]|nr:FeS-binding protein [Chloroflexota bacterium]
MVKRRVRFFFSTDLVSEPVVYLLGKEFDVVTNIRGGEVTHDSGWLYLELSGEDAEIDRAIQWTIERGVRVDPIEGDIIAG